MEIVRFSNTFSCKTSQWFPSTATNPLTPFTFLPPLPTQPHSVLIHAESQLQIKSQLLPKKKIVFPFIFFNKVLLNIDKRNQMKATQELPFNVSFDATQSFDNHNNNHVEYYLLIDVNSTWTATRKKMSQMKKEMSRMK